MTEDVALDPAAVMAKWGEIKHGVALMINRTSDRNDFAVQAGSSLSGDDKASHPYRVSQAVRTCLGTGVDHLHAVNAHVLDLQVLNPFAPFSLARGALENLGAAYWMLHPKRRNDRIERTLRWHAKNFNDQHTALKPLKQSDAAQKKEKFAKLDAIALTRDISTADMHAGYYSSAAIDYVEQNSSRSKPLLSWRVCSGYAHGRPWAIYGMSEQEHLATDEPGVVDVKLTTDPARLLAPVLQAFQLLIDVVEIFEQRRQKRPGV